MDARVERFRCEAERAGTGGVGKRYPKELRRLAVAIAQDRGERPLSELAEELGVNVETLRSWLGQPARFRPVEVEVAAEPEVAVVAGLRLITPRGYRVEGLGMESLAALLRVLG